MFFYLYIMDISAIAFYGRYQEKIRHHAMEFGKVYELMMALARVILVHYGHRKWP